MTSSPHALHPEPLSLSSEWRTVRIKRGRFAFAPAKRNGLFLMLGMYHLNSVRPGHWWALKVELIPLLSWTDYGLEFCCDFLTHFGRGCKVWSSNPLTAPVWNQTHPRYLCDRAADQEKSSLDGSRVKWKWSTISASLCVSLVFSNRPKLRQVCKMWF